MTDASKTIVKVGDDQLVLGEFDKVDDDYGG